MAKHNIIIGGGPAATNAAITIREFDKDSDITLISDEPAHSRMALPYWLAGNIPREQCYTADEAHLKNEFNAAARIGQRVTQIDSANNSVMLSDGSTLPYDNLLIATGSSPVRLDIPGNDLPGVHTLWSLADTEKVLESADGNSRPRVVLVGAGFIGFIVLNAMFKGGWELTVVERESQVLPRMLDAGAASLVQDWLGKQNVDVQCGATVQEIKDAGGSKSVVLDNGTEISADIVILATGIRTNTELADAAGIDTDSGILVNDQMQTSVPNIYAAGDVAQGPVLFSEQREVHAIQPTAVDHGRVAGANMAGQEIHYPGSLLMNVVDVCGLQTASFGAWNDPAAEVMTISSPEGFVYRKLLWVGDQLVGAIFAGRSNDVGMLTDVGMVKGILQTQTKLGAWKQFLKENPFDVRRAYVASGVAKKLAATTLLGRPTRGRSYRHGNQQPTVPVNPNHELFVTTRE
jgi:NADPH-dependent 2,4-dienoyl-CoA reductase/sulfur reductase-like enzyme